MSRSPEKLFLKKSTGGMGSFPTRRHQQRGVGGGHSPPGFLTYHRHLRSPSEAVFILLEVYLLKPGSLYSSEVYL